MDEVNEKETRELLKNVSDMISKRNFSKARELIQSKLNENKISFDLMPQVLSKFVLILYCSHMPGEINFFSVFKEKVKHIPEINEIWPLAKKEIVIDFLTIYQNMYLRTDYYFYIKIWPQIFEFLQENLNQIDSDNNGDDTITSSGESDVHANTSPNNGKNEEESSTTSNKDDKKDSKEEIDQNEQQSPKKEQNELPEEEKENNKETFDISKLITIDNISKICIFVNNFTDSIPTELLEKIASLSINYFKNLIFIKHQKNYNEKDLQKALKFIKEYMSKDDTKIYEQIQNDLVYEYVVSDSLGKQFMALTALNGIRSFSPNILNRLIEIKAIDHFLSGMHQDIVSKFVSFLIKMWNSGQFKEDQLKQFWDLSVNQHQTVIDKFFNEWPRVYANLPKNEIPTFWNIVVSSNKYPESCLDFLIKMSPRAPQKIQLDLIHSLMNVHIPERYICVDCIYEYSKNSQEITQEIINQVLSIINSSNSDPKQMKFCVLLFLKILKKPTEGIFQIILEKVRLEPNDSKILLSLIIYICDYLKVVLNNNEIELIKQIIGPILSEDTSTVRIFLNKLLQMKIITQSSTEHLMKWLLEQSKERTMIEFIFSLFLSTNKIENGNIESFESLIGLSTILDILYQSNESYVSDFVTDLFNRCKNCDSCVSFIDKVMHNSKVSPALIQTMCNLIIDNDIVQIQDYSKLDDVMNLFHFIPTVQIEIFEKNLLVEIPYNASVDYFKKKTAALLQKDYQELFFFKYNKQIYQNQDVGSGNNINSFNLTDQNQVEEEPEELEKNHVFVNEEKIIVKSNSMITSSMKKWKAQQKPYYVLQRYSLQMYEIISQDSNDVDPALGFNCLKLLNFLPTIPKEKELIQSSLKKMNRNQLITNKWEKIFDTNKPFLLFYRLNILGNLIKARKRCDIIQLFESGCFMHFMKILLENREIFYDKQEFIELFLTVLNNLISYSLTIHECDQPKFNCYKLITPEKILNSIVDWVITLFHSHDFNLSIISNNIVSILYDISNDNTEVLAKNANFVTLFDTLIFDKNPKVRDYLKNIVLQMDVNDIEDFVLNNIDNAKNGNCEAYFNLISKIINETIDPKKVWEYLSKAIMNDIFLISPNAILPDDFGREEMYSSQHAKEKAEIQESKVESNDIISKENNKNDKEISTQNTNNEGDIEKEKDHILKPSGSFSVDELKEAALLMSAELADPLFFTSIFESMMILIDKIEGEIPNSLDICLFAINKVAFNISKYVELPPTLFPLVQKILQREKQENVKQIIFSRLQTLHQRSSFPNTNNRNFPLKTLNIDTRKGLYNLGCTCYLNASLQQLLRIPEIRDTILSYRPSTNKDSEILGDWMVQLQLLFARLLYYPTHIIDPKPFIRLFKKSDGSPIYVNEQQDAVEFIQFLMASIDDKIPSKPIEHLMTGKIVHEINSLDPEKEYKGETKEDFITFPLEVRDISDIQESFKIFRLPDLFTGKNQYNADGVGLIDAERNNAVLEAPTTFIFQLKRFDFDMTTFRRIKINSQFTFPLTLDISPILQKPTETIYDLQGIVMHSGDAAGGHYYSYIKDKNNKKWYLFNDSCVSPIDEENVMCNATLTPKNNFFGKFMVNKFASGYLLFYKKRNTENEQNIEPICRLPAKILLYLLQDLQQFMYKNTIFSDEYHSFILNIIQNCSCETLYQMALQYLDLLIYYFNTISANKTKEEFDDQNIIDVFRVMNDKLKIDKEFSNFLLNQPQSRSNLINQNFRPVRRIYTRLICTAIKNSDISEQFLNELYPHFDQIFTQTDLVNIFQPFVSFVEELDTFDDKCNELLQKLINILTVKYQETEQAKQINSFFGYLCDFSQCFKIIFILLKLLQKSNKEEMENLKYVFLDNGFMQTWLKSSKNCFYLSNIIGLYVKDNHEITLKYIKFINDSMNNSSLSWFASQFASALLIDDAYVDLRMNFFFNAISKGNNLEQIIPVIYQEIIALRDDNMLNICEILIKYRGQWVSPWLSHPNQTVRLATLLLIFKLFPVFPAFENESSVPMAFGTLLKEYQDTDISRRIQAIIHNNKLNKEKQEQNQNENSTAKQNDDKESEQNNESQNDYKIEEIDLKYNSLLSDLWEELMKSNKSIALKAKSEDNARIATDYYRVLIWATFYSGKYELVDQLSLPFVKNLEIFCKLTDKSAVVSLLNFMHCYISNPFAFFYDKNLSSFLSLLSKISKKEVKLLLTIAPIFFDMIKCISGDYSKQIVESGFVTSAIPLCIGNEKTNKSMCEFLHNLITEESVEELSQIVFNKTFYKKTLFSYNVPFTDLIQKLIENEKSLDIFLSNQCSYATTEYLQFLIQSGESDKEITVVKILSNVTKRFVQFKKNVKQFLWDPLKPIIDLWSYEWTLLTNLFTQLTDSSCSYELSTAIIELLDYVIHIPKFNEKGISLINASENDIYSLLEPTICVSICKIRNDLLNYKLSQTSANKKKPICELYIKDMEMAISHNVTNVNVFTIYCNSICNNYTDFNFEENAENRKIFGKRLFSLIKEFLIHTDKITCFNSSITMLIPHLSNYITQEDANTMSSACFDLSINKLCNEKGEIIQTELTQYEIQTIKYNFTIVDSFIKEIRAISNINPIITNLDNTISIFEKYTEIIDILQSFKPL